MSDQNSDKFVSPSAWSREEQDAYLAQEPATYTDACIQSSLRQVRGKALSLNLNDEGQNFAGTATIRAAIFDLIDSGDHGLPWRFYEEQTESRNITGDAATTDRVLFVDAVIARIAELQNPPHSGVKLENLCDKHKRECLPAPTARVCRMCEAERRVRNGSS